MYKGHDGNIRSVKFTPDGKNIVSASDDKTVRWVIRLILFVTNSQSECTRRLEVVLIILLL